MPDHRDERRLRRSSPRPGTGPSPNGDVPTGFFAIGIPDIAWADLGTLFVGALTVVFVGFSESLAAAPTMSLKHRYDLDPNKELIASGAARGAAGRVGGFTNGSLSPRPRSPTRPVSGRSWPR